MNIRIVEADYCNEQHKQEIPMFLDEYAKDPMGGGSPLSDSKKQRLVKELSRIPHAFSIIAYANEKPAGLVNCLESFSTFSCQPVINIHDFVVLEKFRGNGISQRMLEKVEAIASERKCCKLTLEVLSNNEIAKSAYSKFGFAGYQLDPEAGVALFWQKVLAKETC